MNNSVIELAAYTVKDSDNYISVQKELHRLIRPWQGYVGSMWLQSIGEPSNFADIAVWSNEENAMSAADKFDRSDDPVARAAKDQIGDLKLFGHFNIKSENNVLATFGEEGAFLEIVANFPSDIAGYEAVQDNLHTALKSELGGVRAGEVLKGDVDDNGTCLVDLVFWVSPENMQMAFEALSKDKRFESFFASGGEPALCELYRVSGVYGMTGKTKQEVAA
jgi:hypothetical protein